MAGNNGLAVEVHKIREDDRGRTGLAQEMEAIEEEIKTLASNSRLRLFRAVDEELRRVLREAMPRLSGAPWPELTPQAWEAMERPPLDDMRHETPGDHTQGVPEHAPVPEVDANASAEQEAVASLNGHKPSPTVATLAVAVAPKEDARGHAGTQSGMEDHEQMPLVVAAERPAPDSGETYSGTVQLVVAAEQSAIQALQFVDALCRHPLMRLQRLLGTARGRLDIWVVLREPLGLKEALLGMAGVSQVNTIPAKGHQDSGVFLEVRLKEPVEAHGS